MNLVSIIIPVRNGEKHLPGCINSLKKLSYGNLEIIFVNDGSTDGTKQLLDGAGGNIKTIETSPVGPSAARNLALGRARGEFVAFTDADCAVEKNWIDELLRGFTDEKTAGVGGDQMSPEDETPFGKNIQDFMKSIGFVTEYMKTQKQLLNTTHNPTCNAMYRKKVLSEIGGFSPGLWPGEDVELDYRIIKKGYGLVFNPSAVVYHYRPENRRKYLKMMFNYGRVQAFLVRRYGFFRKIHCMPILTALSILFMVFSAIKSSFSTVIITSSLSLLAPELYFLARTRNIKRSLAFLELGSYTMFAWNYGFLKGLFSKSPIKK